MTIYFVSMKTLQVSAFKARCLGLLKEIRDTGEPLAVTLRGETLVVIQPPGTHDPQHQESVSETLQRLQPLLDAEDAEFELSPRDSVRRSGRDLFTEDD